MRHLALALLVALTPAAQAKSLVATGGSCASQGAWTTRALDQAKAIATTVQQLSSDPDCKALVDAIQQANAATLFSDPKGEALSSGPGATYETLPSDLMALRTVLMQNPDNQSLSSRISPALAKSAVDIATNNATLMGPLSLADLTGVQQRMKRTAVVGQAMLSALFTALPKQQLCIQKERNAGAGLNLVAASIRMLAAFASANETAGQNVAGLISQLNTFLREMKSAKIISELNLAQFYSEMTCLIETTQQSYCAAKDGLELLNFQAQEAKVLADLRANLAKGKVSKDSAIEGYVLLGREVSTITAWLQKVQAGIEPKTINDANFKNNILGSVDGLTKQINMLQGTYNENLSVYRTLESKDLKQQNIRMLIDRMKDIILDQRIQGMNFFTQAVSERGVVFFLLGRVSPEGRVTIPDEVLGKNISMPMDPMDYIQDDSRTTELRDPDALMVLMLEQLKTLSDLALKQGAQYFAQNMTVDHLNLVDEAFSGSNVSVYKSLQNTRDYLVRMAKKYSTYGGDAGKMNLSIADTVARIDRVLAKFELLSKTADEFNLDLKRGTVNLNVINTLPPERQEKVRNLYKDLITSVYEEFNLLLQKESFVAQRLSTYVRFDLHQRVMNREDMSPYVQYLLIASGKSMVYRMQDFSGAELEADLSEAMRLNMKNLDEVEDLFAGDVWNMLDGLARDTGNPYVKAMSKNPFRPWYTAITDLPSNMWDQMVRHPFSPYISKGVRQDETGALSFLRAKICTQTLAFKNWTQFQILCQGAVLESRMTSDAPADLHLKVAYADLVAEKGMSFWQKLKLNVAGSVPENKRYQHVCALRDFYRNNQVYWLTLDMGQTGTGAPGVDLNTPPETPNPFN